MRRKSLYVFSIVAALVLVLTTGGGSALAHVCFPADKPTGAGSVGTINFATGEFTPNKNNPFKGELTGEEPPERIHGGFITLDAGALGTYDVFVHQTLPPVLNEKMAEKGMLCDGKGIDSVAACLGF